MANDVDNQAYYVGAMVLFGAIFLLIAWDMVLDYSEGRNWAHLSVELVVLLAAAGGIGLLLRQLYRARVAIHALGRDLAQVREDAERWRHESRDLIDGLSAAIDRQFARWNLTRAEAEIGLLLLKGLSHKELAEIRQTSERTVREQARSLYRKAGLSGRSSLSAFFLEDLLLPVASRDRE